LKLLILDDIYLVSAGLFGLGHFADCSVYLIDCGEALALIDAGAGIDNRKLVANIHNHGFDVHKTTYLINTHSHYDHAGGDKGIKDLSQCKICIHEKGANVLETGRISSPLPSTVRFYPTPVDKRLTDNDRLRIGKYEFEIVYTPGHSDDGICILMEHPQGRVIFTGDTTMAFGQPGILSAKSDLHAYCRSIERLSKLGVDIMFPGHGVFVLSQAYEHINLLNERLTRSWSDFVLHPPHPFWGGAMIRKKLGVSAIEQGDSAT
jgi:hydroxyacylglutathione hydrolase